MIGFEITLDDKKHDAILFTDGSIYINDQARKHDPASNFYESEEELRLALPEAHVRIIGPVCDLSQMSQDIEEEFQHVKKDIDRRFDRAKQDIERLRQSMRVTIVEAGE